MQAQSKYRNGEFAHAHGTARDAKKFNIIGIGVGIGIHVLALSAILAIVIIIAIVTQQNN